MDKNNGTQPTFEEALNELESIVKLMEEGNLGLDEALANFEKGIALARICAKKLAQAEKKIDILLCSEDGEVTLQAADLSEETNE